MNHCPECGSKLEKGSTEEFAHDISTMYHCNPCSQVWVAVFNMIDQEIPIYKEG